MYRYILTTQSKKDPTILLQAWIGWIVLPRYSNYMAKAAQKPFQALYYTVVGISPMHTILIALALVATLVVPNHKSADQHQKWGRVGSVTLTFITC